MAAEVSRTAKPTVKRRARAVPVDRALQIFADRARWTAGHRRDRGHEGEAFWVVPGTDSSHGTDLLNCTCERRQFMKHGPDTACNHMLAVRLWFTRARTREIARHPKGPDHQLPIADWDHFLAQDLILADVADSLLRVYGLASPARNWPDPDGRPVWLAPGDRWGDVAIPDALEPPPDRDDALAARQRRLALVDDDATPDGMEWP
jgi:hypothetical protein